jgi:hypothetical protein
MTIDGWKTYLGGAGLILTGAITSYGGHPTEGGLAVAAGMTAIGFGHKAQKILTMLVHLSDVVTATIPLVLEGQPPAKVAEAAAGTGASTAVEAAAAVAPTPMRRKP